MADQDEVGGAIRHHTPKQHFELMTWLSAKREWITNSKMSLGQIARAASDSLKFACTDHHVRARMRDLSIPPPQTAKGGGAKLRQEMANDIQAIREKVETLEVRLASLEFQLGVRKVDEKKDPPLTAVPAKK